jgi:hypothetical protein
MLLLRDIAHQSDQDSVSIWGPERHTRELWVVLYLCTDATCQSTKVAASRLWGLEGM